MKIAEILARENLMDYALFEKNKFYTFENWKSSKLVKVPLYHLQNKIH